MTKDCVNTKKQVKKEKKKSWVFYGRFLSSKLTKITVIMTAMPVPIVYISYGGIETGCVGVGVCVVGASTTLTYVVAKLLPYESSPAKVAAIVY